jgi:hypothetical protein
MVQIIEDTITEYNILPENIYNIGETSTAIRTISTSYVVVNKDQVQKYQGEPRQQE